MRRAPPVLPWRQSRARRKSDNGKLVGQIGNLYLAGLTGIFRQANDGRPPVDPGTLDDRAPDFMRAAAEPHDVQHDEATAGLAAELHADRPIWIV